MGGQPSSDATVESVSESVRGPWRIATTENFRVYSLGEAAEAKNAAIGAENIRRELSASLGLLGDIGPWSPKCQIILYPTRQRYCAAIGGQFASTLGSSLVRPQTGKITMRRIDLRTDVKDYLTEALPHEFVHVLLADQFRDGPPPLWYDEGLALLADSAVKRALHERDLQRGLLEGIDRPLAQLMTTKKYPQSGQLGVFYGQCASLTQFLYRQGPPERIHQFIERSDEIGVNLALVECYNIDGLPQLERLWRTSVKLERREVLAPALPSQSDAARASGLARQ